MNWRPLGSKGSPNYHAVVLLNWARRYGVNIGRLGYGGVNFGVWLGPCFVVERRGSGRTVTPKEFPFSTKAERRRAFAEAKAAWAALKGKEAA